MPSKVEKIRRSHMVTDGIRLPLGVRKKGGEHYEVGVTNIFGQFRLEDFWNPYGGVTEEECQRFIKELQLAAGKITAEILNDRE